MLPTSPLHHHLDICTYNHLWTFRYRIHPTCSFTILRRGSLPYMYNSELSMHMPSDRESGWTDSESATSGNDQCH